MPIIAGGLAAIQNNKRTDLKFKIAPKGNLKRAPSGYEVNVEAKLNYQPQGRKNLLQSGWARLKSILTGSKVGEQKSLFNKEQTKSGQEIAHYVNPAFTN